MLWADMVCSSHCFGVTDVGDRAGGRLANYRLESLESLPCTFSINSPGSDEAVPRKFQSERPWHWVSVAVTLQLSEPFVSTY